MYANADDEPNFSRCTGGCAASWPPLIVSGGTDEFPREGVDADLVGTIERSDGGEQVTYNGRPLYNFVGDRNKGDARGSGVANVWFTVSPDGELVK